MTKDIYRGRMKGTQAYKEGKKREKKERRLNKQKAIK
jgi:hypothetical protein